MKKIGYFLLAVPPIAALTFAVIYDPLRAGVAALVTVLICGGISFDLRRNS
jgi:hypothetical protein